MANASLARSGRETTTRVERGRELYFEHADDIRFADGVWYVPNQHDATTIYEVVLGHQGETCACADYDHHGHEEPCEHVFAATMAWAKTAPCNDCGQRFRHRALFEVAKEHGSLSHFVGDQLCEPCAIAGGIL